MSQYNINSIIEFIGEFFSELPPQALAIIISISTVCIYALGGFVIATIIAFLAFAVTQSSAMALGSFALIILVSVIYGLFRAILAYKKLMHSFENQ